MRLPPTPTERFYPKIAIDLIEVGGVEDATTTEKGIVELATSGESAANVAVQGNDARLSDARTPTAHTHPLSEITGDGALAALNTVGAGEIDNDAVTLAKMQNRTGPSVIGKEAAGAGDPEQIAVGTGLQISGATLSSTITQYTDENAQDAVGGMVDASLAYVDGTPLLQRAALTGEVTASAGSNATTVAASHSGSTHAAVQSAAEATAAAALSAHEAAGDPHPTYLTASEGNASYQPVDADLTTLAANITAAGHALVDDANAATQLVTLGLTATAAELNHTDGVTSALQGQLDGKQPLDTQLTDLAGLAYAGNAAKSVAVKATEDGFELVAPTAPNPNVVQNSTGGASRSIAAGYSIYIPGKYEIGAGVSLEISAGACMEIG